MRDWEEFRSELDLSVEEENAIEFEKELIRAYIKIGDKQGMSQAEVTSLQNAK